MKIADLIRFIKKLKEDFEPAIQFALENTKDKPELFKYHCKELLNYDYIMSFVERVLNINEIETYEDYIKFHLIRLLENNWNYNHNRYFDPTYYTDSPVTQFLWEIAKLMTKEDPNKNIYQLMIPSLTVLNCAVTLVDLSDKDPPMSLREFVLSDDENAILDLTMVMQNVRNFHPMTQTSVLDSKGKLIPLTPSEIARVYHKHPIISKYYDAIKNFQASSLLGALLMKFGENLYKSSVVFVPEEQKNATEFNAREASNLEIVEFVTFMEKLKTVQMDSDKFKDFIETYQQQKKTEGIEDPGIPSYFDYLMSYKKLRENWEQLTNPEVIHFKEKIEKLRDSIDVDDQKLYRDLVAPPQMAELFKDDNIPSHDAFLQAWYNLIMENPGNPILENQKLVDLIPKDRTCVQLIGRDFILFTKEHPELNTVEINFEEHFFGMDPETLNKVLEESEIAFMRYMAGEKLQDSDPLLENESFTEAYPDAFYIADLYRFLCERTDPNQVGIREKIAALESIYELFEFFNNMEWVSNEYSSLVSITDIVSLLKDFNYNIKEVIAKFTDLQKHSLAQKYLRSLLILTLEGIPLTRGSHDIQTPYYDVLNALGYTDDDVFFLINFLKNVISPPEKSLFELNYLANQFKATKFNFQSAIAKLGGLDKFAELMSHWGVRLATKFSNVIEILKQHGVNTAELYNNLSTEGKESIVSLFLKDFVYVKWNHNELQQALTELKAFSGYDIDINKILKKPDDGMLFEISEFYVNYWLEKTPPTIEDYLGDYENVAELFLEQEPHKLIEEVIKIHIYDPDYGEIFEDADDLEELSILLLKLSKNIHEFYGVVSDETVDELKKMGIVDIFKAVGVQNEKVIRSIIHAGPNEAICMQLIKEQLDIIPVTEITTGLDQMNGLDNFCVEFSEDHSKSIYTQTIDYFKGFTFLQSIMHNYSEYVNGLSDDEKSDLKVKIVRALFGIHAYSTKQNQVYTELRDPVLTETLLALGIDIEGLKRTFSRLLLSDVYEPADFLNHPFKYSGMENCDLRLLQELSSDEAAQQNYLLLFGIDIINLKQEFEELPTQFRHAGETPNLSFIPYLSDNHFHLMLSSIINTTSDNYYKIPLDGNFQQIMSLFTGREDSVLLSEFFEKISIEIPLFYREGTESHVDTIPVIQSTQTPFEVFNLIIRHCTKQNLANFIAMEKRQPNELYCLDDYMEKISASDFKRFFKNCVIEGDLDDATLLLAIVNSDKVSLFEITLSQLIKLSEADLLSVLLSDYHTLITLILEKIGPERFITLVNQERLELSKVLNKPIRKVVSILALVTDHFLVKLIADYYHDQLPFEKLIDLFILIQDSEKALTALLDKVNSQQAMEILNNAHSEVTQIKLSAERVNLLSQKVLDHIKSHLNQIEDSRIREKLEYKIKHQQITKQSINLQQINDVIHLYRNRTSLEKPETSSFAPKR